MTGVGTSSIGAHVEGHNHGTLGVCRVDGYGASADDTFERNFTVAQAAAVTRLIGEIKGRATIRKVSEHNDYAAKACPRLRIGTAFANK